jgi:hypothetical protein
LIERPLSVTVRAVTRIIARIMLFLAAVCGCGPIEYMNQVTRRAATAVEAAKAVNADKWAPYEYTCAVEYLHKAREEEAQASHQSAIAFGHKAEDNAEKARQLSLERAHETPGTTAP